ncbi:MAG: proline dehydrogenase family protein [Balneolaceae bacterium]
MKLPFALAKRFVAGETFERAVPQVRAINEKGIAVTLDLLGEYVKERDVASQNVEDYIQLIQNIERVGINSTISIKLTMIGLKIDRMFCEENLFRLLQVAREKDLFVRIDMEGSDVTQDTIEVFQKAYKEFGKHVGIVLQAYLHRTKDDVRELAEAGADIRLCKGAYREPERVALQKMPAIRDAFKDYATILLDKTPFPRIATHDDELVNWVQTYTREQSIGPSRFEFQMLYGLRQETMEQLTADGYKTRVYVPYGTMWFPYFKRRLLERKENIFFVASTMFKK